MTNINLKIIAAFIWGMVVASIFAGLVFGTI
jgi:CHASE3 domain sensor protein